jgi:energy-coupling factor transporter transmembrane protein EcfT
VYSGYIHIGLALWEVIWLAIVGGYFLWTRRLFIGILVATVLAFVLTRLLPLPEWTFTQVAFFHPLTLFVSDRTLLVAITKVVGYSGMILSTIALVVTSRDAEFIGALRQLRIPQPIVFFLSTVFRALNLAISDYEIIHQAQIARAINARPRSFIRRLRDLGNIAVPMVALMIRRSSEIGDALLARGYSLGRPSADFYETSPWRRIDWLVLACSLCLLYLALGPHPTVTALLQGWFSAGVMK